MYLLVGPDKKIISFKEHKKINDNVVLLYGDEIVGKECYLIMMLEKNRPTESKYKLYISDKNMDIEDLKKYNGNFAEVINKFKDKKAANSNDLVINWIEEYEIKQCAEIIKDNTTSLGLKDWLKDMIRNIHLASTEIDDFLYLYDVFRYIVNDGYDISDFEFYEHPHDLVYVFYNKDTEEMFDVVVEESEDSFELSAAYVNDDRECVKVSSIKKAIYGYKNSNWDK